MAIAIAIKIFGRAEAPMTAPRSRPRPGPPRAMPPPRDRRGGRGAGDCEGRCANSWPCLSPQLLPLLTKIKANRDKSRFIEHGRRRQGVGPARGSRPGTRRRGRRGVCSVETTAARAGAGCCDRTRHLWLDVYTCTRCAHSVLCRSNGHLSYSAGQPPGCLAVCPFIYTI